MNFHIEQIKVRDLVKSYKDNDEEGVVGYDGKLDIRPPYQREFIYKDEQRCEVIKSIMNKRPLGLMYWAENDNDTYELMDGQQRTLSICQYCNGDFSVEFNGGEPLGFYNLDDTLQNKILDYELLVYVCNGNQDEKLSWFKTINIAQMVMTEQELLNAVYVGRWLTDAKKKFSKTNCVAYRLANKLMNGTPIRQDYLETALRWITNGEKKGVSYYMATHQNDSDAFELWGYFQNVIAWVNAKFPRYRKEMKGIEWGLLYNKYHANSYDADELEKEVSRLMADDDVTKKKGIYEYVLSNKKNESVLNIRTFTESQKRTAYERQGGICPICGEHHEYEEMEGDHITPWHLGGKTSLDNLQMICKHCNRTKGGK